jgi:hypothetical protein
MAVSPHDATHINAELAHHVGGRNSSGKSSGGCAARDLEKLRRVVCGWAQSVQAG